MEDKNEYIVQKINNISIDDRKEISKYIYDKYGNKIITQNTDGIYIRLEKLNNDNIEYIFNFIKERINI